MILNHFFRPHSLKNRDRSTTNHSCVLLHSRTYLLDAPHFTQPCLNEKIVAYQIYLLPQLLNSGKLHNRWVMRPYGNRISSMHRVKLKNLTLVSAPNLVFSSSLILFSV